MAGEIIQVDVQDAEDRARVRTLDGRDEQDLAKDGMVFDRTGLRPLQPVLPAVIGSVEHDGAAERAGLQAGDRIIRAGDEPVADWRQWRSFIERHPGQPFTVRIERDHVEQTLELTPDSRENEQGQRIGFIKARADIPVDLVHLSLIHI